MLRRFFGGAVLLACFSGMLLTQGQQIDYATPIVKKALKAVGDAEKQMEMQGFTVEDTTKFKIDEQKFEITGTWSFQGLEKARGDINAKINGNVVNVVLVFNKDKGWLQNVSDGNANELPEEVIRFVAPNFAALRMVQRPMILLNPVFTLEPLGELKVDNRMTVGVKASRKDHPDVEIYYDKVTFLPSKMTLRVREQMAENESEYSYHFSNYKEFQGLKQFTKMTFFRDGEKRYEKTLSSPKFSSSLPNNLFAKP